MRQVRKKEVHEYVIVHTCLAELGDELAEVPGPHLTCISPHASPGKTYRPLIRRTDVMQHMLEGDMICLHEFKTQRKFSFKHAGRRPMLTPVIREFHGIKNCRAYV